MKANIGTIQNEKGCYKTEDGRWTQYYDKLADVENPGQAIVICTDMKGDWQVYKEGDN